MAKLTTEQLQNELAAKGYTLVSDEGYKNMNSIIRIQCPHGHLIETSLVDFRHPSFECPVCVPNINFINPSDVPEKDANTVRIIAFDQATEKFGLSIWDNGKLVFYNLYTFKGVVISRIAQIRKFVQEFVINKWKPDFIMMEDIQYQSGGYGGGLMTFKVLAMLLGNLEELLTENNIEYNVVSPNVWRKYAGTAGKNRTEEKMLSVAKVKERFNIKVNDDIAESILIGSYAVKIHYSIKKAF